MDFLNRARRRSCSIGLALSVEDDKLAVEHNVRRKHYAQFPITRVHHNRQIRISTARETNRSSQIAPLRVR